MIKKFIPPLFILFALVLGITTDTLASASVAKSVEKKALVATVAVVAPEADKPAVLAKATVKPAAKAAVAKKPAAKKKAAPKKVVKEKLTINPPLITVDTAPHSPKPAAKKKVTPVKKKTTTKA